jgi:hypothetical protein
MGGGGGVSIPGTFRVATDRTVRQLFCLRFLSIADKELIVIVQ